MRRLAILALGLGLGVMLAACVQTKQLVGTWQLDTGGGPAMLALTLNADGTGQMGPATGAAPKEEIGHGHASGGHPAVPLKWSVKGQTFNMTVTAGSHEVPSRWAIGTLTADTLVLHNDKTEMRLKRAPK